MNEVRIRLRHLFSVLLCRMWQHEKTGRVVELPFWRHPGRRWQRCDWKE